MNYLLQNIWLKIIALFMGVLVWLHVATERVYNHQVKLPLTAVELKDSLTLSEIPPDSILVEVSASGKQLLRQQWRERGLRVNASQFQAGRFQLNLDQSIVSLVGSPADISLEDVLFPRQIDMYIDFLSYKTVNITPDIIAEADDGFAVSNVSVVSSSQVELSGPASKLSRFSSLKTEQKKLESLRSTIDLKVAVKAPDEYGFEIRPDSVTVKVDIVPVKTRVYKDIPIVIFNAPPSVNLNTDPKAIQVELTGPPEDIDLLNRNALTVSIDYKQTTLSEKFAVKVDCPANFKVKRVSNDSVKVIVQ